MKHSPAGPSRLHRLSLCPGSLAQCDGIPDEPNEYAKKGTFLHDIMAKRLRGVFSEKEALEKAGEDDYAIRSCLNYVKIVKERHPATIKLVEKTLNATSIHPDMEYATLDYALVEPFRRGVLVDWKFTHRAPPTVRKNLQTAAYVVALADAYELSEVEATIVLGYTGWYDTYVYNKQDIQRARERIYAIVEACKVAWAPLIASADACRYCPALLSCPSPNEHFVSIGGSPILALGGRHIDNGSIAKMLDAGDIAELKIKASRAVAYKRLSAGAKIGKFALVEGRARRRWKENVKGSDLVALAAEVEKDANGVVGESIISPSRLEKKWGKGKKIRESMKTMVEHVPGEKKLVKMEDE